MLSTVSRSAQRPDGQARTALPQQLRAAYAECRRLHRKHDAALFAGSLMLPPARRPHVDALYAHARMLDQVVDEPGVGAETAGRRLDERTAAFERAVKEIKDAAVDGREAEAAAALAATDPVTAAAAHTATLYSIPPEHFASFAEAMRSDLTVTEYATYRDLMEYMYGAAALLGLQLVPVLEPVDPQAPTKAVAVGYALQMTNILRDIDEDLDRGRIYLPGEDLARFGIDPAALRARRPDGQWKDLLRFEEARAREYYAEAHAAVQMLHPSSRECVSSALTLYSRILDELAASDYQVFGTRHGIGKMAALRLAVPAYIRARRSWKTVG